LAPFLFNIYIITRFQVLVWIEIFKVCQVIQSTYSLDIVEAHVFYRTMLLFI
jgi:hypothetical protein